MTLRIRALQHVAFEQPALIAEWARERGHHLAITPIYEGVELPQSGDFDLLVVMGGPMSVHDEAVHPWLAAEKRLLGDVLETGGAALGICLGAQLIAEVLGARVFQNAEREIGWFPVQFTRAARESGCVPRHFDQLLAYHWHGETFDLPPGAVHLAESAGCRHQAFAVGRSLALQFHLEMDRAAIERIIRHCPSEIGVGPYMQSAEEMLVAQAHFGSARAALFELLDHAFGG